MSDVRISTHYAKTAKHDFAIIKFYNDLECLIKTNEYEEFLLHDFKTRKLIRVDDIKSLTAIS